MAAKFTSLGMGPAPDTDVEEEEFDNRMDEDRGEVIMDLFSYLFHPFLTYRL